MTAAAILSECQRRGVHLRADGELIKYKPIAAVGPELLEAMRENKPELIAYLRRHEPDRSGPWSPPGKAPDLEQPALFEDARCHGRPRELKKGIAIGYAASLEY